MSQAQPPVIMGKRSLLSSANMRSAMPVCLVLLRHLTWMALALALDNDGNRMAAKMAMMAMTTSNSMRVKAYLLVDFGIGWSKWFISQAHTAKRAWIDSQL